MYCNCKSDNHRPVAVLWSGGSVSNCLLSGSELITDNAARCLCDKCRNFLEEANHKNLITIA